MNPNLKIAILEFLANEYHLPAADISSDTGFYSDLKLNADEVADLLTRMQDALNFTLSEDKLWEIRTIDDLFLALDPEPVQDSLDE